MYVVDLCHLGDNCEPGIIIDDILNIRKKCLFMLGHYNFNNIVNYLYNGGVLENIYERNSLRVENSSNTVWHTKLNFGFNHDYKIEANNITNYDFVKNRFDEKIRNFRESIHINQNRTVFINFSTNVDSLNIDKMVNWFKNHKQNVYFVFFTNNNFSRPSQSANVSIIKIDRSYSGWWEKPNDIKTALYREIYEKFIWSLNSNNISHDFPSNFNQTHYGKSH